MVPNVISSIVVVSILICCALFHSIGDLKDTQMNVQCSLIQELMIYKFELGHNIAKIIKKNLFC